VVSARGGRQGAANLNADNTDPVAEGDP